MLYYPPISKSKSHHSLVYFSIDVVLDEPVETPVLKYMMNKADFNQMRSYIRNVDWEKELDVNMSRDEWGWGDVIVICMPAKSGRPQTCQPLLVYP